MLGALIECKHNAHVRCSTPVFWLCLWCLPLPLRISRPAPLACDPNAPRRQACAPKAAILFTLTRYLLGSLLFLLAAICGWPHQVCADGLHSLTHSRMHALTHSLTHSLTPTGARERARQRAVCRRCARPEG